MRDPQRVRWAILGTSPISKTMAEAIQASTLAELSAIGTGSLDKSHEKSAAFARDFSIPTVHKNYQAVLDDPNIDVVYIGLANHLHKEWIIRCAKAGKHILCEKPFVLDLSEWEEVFAVIKENNVFCMEALMYLCHPFIQELQKLIYDEEKGIGNIITIHATYYANFAHLENPIAGGAIRNLGCYPISLVRLLMNDEPVEIRAQGVLNADQTKDQIAMAILKFKNNIMAQISTSNNTNTWSQLNIVGKNGVMTVKTNPWMPSKENVVVIKRDGIEKEYRFGAEKSLYTYQIDFVNEHIKAGQFVPNKLGVTWEHSRGNIVVLEEWRKQVNNFNTLEPSNTPTVRLRFF